MQLTVGQKATRSKAITMDDVKVFADLTGDFNPLHFDESFAAKTRFKRLIVQGGLTTGLLNALVATDMPGPGTVFLSQNLAEAEVLELHESKPVSKLKIVVHRESGESVLEGEAWCYTFSPDINQG